MRLADLDGKRVLVWGLGREGRAALELLADKNWCRPASVETFDDGARELGNTGPVPEYLLDGVDVIIKSPGVSRYRPELRAFVAAGGTVTGLTALVIAERSGRRVVGVTGTKGKSTTAGLIAHLIAAAGESVELAGNMGRPAVETLNSPESWLVLECSSYQCADIEPTPGSSPEIGVFTSIYQEHLDWHLTYGQYVSDKMRLFATCDTTLVNAMQPELVRVTDGSFGPVGGRRLIRDSGVGTPPGDGELVDLGRLNLVGLHNRRNANLAVHAASHVMGLVHRCFEPALAAFQPLEHRLHVLGHYGNLTVVDDVLATAPEAVLSALEVFADRPVILLLGGYDRAIDYRDFALSLVTQPRVRVIAMGPAGARIADEMERASGTRPVSVATLVEAVDLVDPVAFGPAERGVLLLSPGATSYGEFADYRERSARFRSLLLQRGMVLA